MNMPAGEAGLSDLGGRLKVLGGTTPLFAHVAIATGEAPRVLPGRDGVVLKNRSGRLSA